MRAAINCIHRDDKKVKNGDKVIFFFVAIAACVLLHLCQVVGSDVF